MATVEHNAVLETSAEQAWKVLSSFGGIAEWHSAIIHSEIEDGQPDSVIGAVRRLHLAGGGVIRERLLSLDNTHMSLTYEFEDSPLPLDNYRASFKVIRVSGQPQCIVEWHASFDVRDAEMTSHFEALITSLVVDGHNSLSLYLVQ
jgi:hypothetical protein